MKTHLHPHVFSDWETRTWPCGQCGWWGTGKIAVKQYLTELFELRCPRCRERITLIRTMPSLDETRAAVEGGDAEAQEHLELLLGDEESRAQPWAARD